MWVLGSSDYGAQLAAQLGLPYSFAQFIGGDYPQVTRAYRQLFQPSEYLAQPHVMVTIAAIVAPTDEEADLLALPTLLAVLRRTRGLSSELPVARRSASLSVDGARDSPKRAQRAT